VVQKSRSKFEVASRVTRSISFELMCCLEAIEAGKLGPSSASSDCIFVIVDEEIEIRPLRRHRL
jgi:hypothetical protein